MTLQVHQVPAAHVTHLAGLEAPQRIPGPPEPLQVVKPTRQVDRHAVIPVRAVQRAPAGGSSIAAFGRCHHPREHSRIAT
jgi:hypothetical protein